LNNAVESMQAIYAARPDDGPAILRPGATIEELDLLHFLQDPALGFELFRHMFTRHSEIRYAHYNEARARRQAQRRGENMQVEPPPATNVQPVPPANPSAPPANPPAPPPPPPEANIILDD